MLRLQTMDRHRLGLHLVLEGVITLSLTARISLFTRRLLDWQPTVTPQLHPFELLHEGCTLARPQARLLLLPDW